MLLLEHVNVGAMSPIDTLELRLPNGYRGIDGYWAVNELLARGDGTMIGRDKMIVITGGSERDRSCAMRAFPRA
jgi:hypothetical protein